MSADQVCWLLEWAGDKHLPVRYFAADEHQPVMDPNLATRFSRREDALAVGKAVGMKPVGQWRIPSTGQCTAVEHMFMAERPAKGPEGTVERVARALWFDWCDQLGWPNGQPTWDEMAAWLEEGRPDVTASTGDFGMKIRLVANRCEEVRSLARAAIVAIRGEA